MNSQNKSSKEFQIKYVSDFRDPVLKINDDRKIQLNLKAIQTPGISILLLVKQAIYPDEVEKEGEFRNAWMRLANEDTNQTLDYSLIKNIKKPEDYEALIQAPADEEGAAPISNPLTYIHGRLHLNDHKVWVFESYKHAF